MKTAAGLFLKPSSPKEKERFLFALPGHAVTIGTAETADVRLNDMHCSGLHALVEIKDEERAATIIDLGSAFGTFAGEKRISERKLKYGECFRIGAHQLVVREIEKNTETNQADVARQPVSHVPRKQEKPLTLLTLLQVRLFWGEQPLDINTFEIGSKITIGPQIDSVFHLPLARAEEQQKPYTIASYDRGELTLSLPLEIHGLVWIGQETYSIDTFRHNDGGKTEFGDVVIKLRVGDRAHLEIGELSLSFDFVEPSESLPRWSAKENDRTLWKSLLSVFVLGLLIFTVLSMVKPEEKVQSIDDVPEHLKKVLYDAGIADAIRKQQAAIGELAANLQGGRARSDEGQSSGRKEPEVTKAVRQETHQTAKPIENPNAPRAEKIKNIEAAFSKSTEVTVTPLAVTGERRDGNTASALTGGAFARGTKGFGAGGGGESVGVGQLKGLGTGGGMGAGDYGLAPSKGHDVDVRQVDEIETLGGLDPDIIAAVIKRYLPQIRHCYEQQLTKNPSLKGKIKVAFTIGGQGTVLQAAVADTTMKHAQTENCVLDKIRKWQFPKPRGGGTVGVKYPFLLMSNNGSN